MVAVTGANGYVGAHLVHALASKGKQVVSIVRPRTSPEDLALMQSLNTQVRKAEITDVVALQAALQGIETVLNLVGSIQPHTGISMYETHVLTTEALVNAAR